MGTPEKRIKLSILISFEIQADKYTPFGGTYSKIGAIEEKSPQLLCENDTKMHKGFHVLLYKKKIVKQINDYPNHLKLLLTSATILDKIQCVNIHSLRFMLQGIVIDLQRKILGRTIASLEQP